MDEKGYQLSCGFVLRDDTYSCGTPTNFQGPNKQNCLYFDRCFFLHGTVQQMRHFANLILSKLPEELVEVEAQNEVKQ